MIALEASMETMLHLLPLDQNIKGREDRKATRISGRETVLDLPDPAEPAKKPERQQHSED
jgi:hypothetical protein